MSLQPRLSFKTMDAVAAVICGNSAEGLDEPVSPYRTGSRLEEFFREDLGLTQPQQLILGSRQPQTKSWLKCLNRTREMARIVEAAVRPGDYVGTDFVAEEAVAHLNAFLQHDNLRLVASGPRWALVSCRGVALSAASLPDDVLSDEYILEMEGKCDARLAQGDLEGAVTTARTLLEALGEIETRITGARSDHKGNLPKQFKAVAKLLKMDTERDDLDAQFKNVVRGLVTVVAGLAPLRNRISDGHARVRRPAPHHARVVVNAAKTVAGFLAESYDFQRSRGSLE